MIRSDVVKACGLIVEYNPFHNGHLHHLEASREHSGAECMIAVMSSQFLQRGEPSIMDKWHRASAALASGVDLVVELPHLFAVEHSDYFSKGAVLTLRELGVDAICFGSEHGDIQSFKNAVTTYLQQQHTFDSALKKGLAGGLSFPDAAKGAYEYIGLTGEMDTVDLSQPNNILGFGYVKQILNHSPEIAPLTIKRIQSHYHDETIDSNIASATSIRKELFLGDQMTELAKASMPESTTELLQRYKQHTGSWHDWERYFPLLHYKLLTMSPSELREIHTVDEGLEYRLKKAVTDVDSFHALMEQVKTKRYTWTRLQRMFVHIICNTKKKDASDLLSLDRMPYVRVLGMNDVGQRYLRSIKKDMDVPLVTQLQQLDHPLLNVEERASGAYYSALQGEKKNTLLKQELQPPIRIGQQ
ncbi:nucleotidyltransferase [Thalassobacillus hwangdonensis]|uniref:tRNA(Met) cytidine acetate ligase n=1 Tax=Thalassobacillus hwangdonensis TaxID=546108 RepID=A0ABW3KXU8_9BACI